MPPNIAPRSSWPTSSTHPLRPESPNAPPDAPDCYIDVLSDDILITVFCLFPERSIQSLNYVLTLSHVCQRWRSLCIGCGELWRRYALLPVRRRLSSPQAGRYDFNEELLRRTSNAGLQVGWENISEIPNRAYPPLLLTHLVNHAHHLEELWIRFDCLGAGTMRHDDYVVVRALEQCSAAQLKFLSLSSSPYYRTPTLPNTLFGGEVVSLTELVIERVWFDLPKMKFGKNLRTLVVTAHASSTGGEDELHEPDSFSEWVDTVRRYAGLTDWDLSISEGISSPPPRPRAFEPTNVTLAALTRLAVDSMTMADLKYLNDWVSLPSCKRLHIKVRSAEGAEEQRALTTAFVLNHSNHHVQDYAEMTIFNAGVFGFGFGLSREARATGTGAIDPARLRWQATDISLFFNQAHLPVRPGPGCHPVEYRAFLEPLGIVARAVPTLIIFPWVYGPTRSTGTVHGTMKPADYASTRELITGGYEGGSVRNIVGYRPHVEEMLDCQVTDAGNGLHLKPSNHIELRLIPVVDGYNKA